MKKKLSIVLVIILAVAMGVAVWFYGYYNRNSNDNLPALSAIAEMSESDVNSLLPGYNINQLREVWGEPDFSEDGTDSWQTGNVTLIVHYKNNGVVAICGLKDDSGASVSEFESQTEPTSTPVLHCKSIQESAAWSFIDPNTVTVLSGEWAYTSQPNGYVALVTFNYTNKFDEYETAEYVVLGVFGGEASTVHCLNEHSPYTRENVLQEFGAIDDQRFTLE